MSHKGRKCHVCCLLLPRPPGPSLDRGYIELRLGNSSEAGRRHIPGQVATHRVGRTARDARGNQCPSGHRRKHERLGNLGEQLVHPAPSALSIPSKLIDPSDNRCRLAKTSRAAISTWGSCWYLHATRPIPPQMRPSDGYAPGWTASCLVALNLMCLQALYRTRLAGHGHCGVAGNLGSPAGWSQWNVSLNPTTGSYMAAGNLVHQYLTELPSERVALLVRSTRGAVPARPVPGIAWRFGKQGMLRQWSRHRSAQAGDAHGDAWNPLIFQGNSASDGCDNVRAVTIHEPCGMNRRRTAWWTGHLVPVSVDFAPSA